jgi:2,4-dienoyl-CoA reductase-like NADH-dependent reductase (Old Yellow Enzyme family)
MGVLFEPFRIGPLEVKNRFVRSATFECRGDGLGGVTDKAVAYYRALGRGGIGTIITGFMYVRQDGKGGSSALGIDRDELISGLRGLAEAMKADGSRAVFQLHHAGGQARKLVTGSPPRSPSADGRDRFSRIMMGRRSPLSADEIRQLAADFGAAARRAREAGADGVQIHAAHGYLLSEFLPPYHNRRDDDYGVDVDGRYRFLGEVIGAVRAEVGSDFPVLVKMNVDDGTPEPGMTPDLAAEYAARLVGDGVDCLEISAGATVGAPFVMCRGEAHTGEFASVAPWPVRRLFERTIAATPQPPFMEAYNGAGIAPVKAALGSVPLALVGGMRTLPVMEECVASGTADLISMSRPLVREPGLIAKLQADPATIPACISCNRCLAACYHDLPVRCYVNGLPKKGGRDQ